MTEHGAARAHERQAPGATASPGQLALSHLIAPARTVALVGLAKNTGKTQTLTVLLSELATTGRRVGVTSIGRDGEERDVLDRRIAKPRVCLVAGSLVATTDALLRTSGVAYQLLLQTGVRTPLGNVLIARLEEQGTIEVAGPSSAADMRSVSEAMLGFGATQVLIDGAIDRRAASSPDVSDGLVIATGAILHDDIERIVALTADAVELVRLPQSGDGGDSAERVTLRRQLVLESDPAEIASLLRERPQANVFVVTGALSERFLEGLLGARRERAARELRLIVQDATKVFLSRRAPSWYLRQGLTIEVQRPIELLAITVNPVAPQSHSFDSEQLRKLIERAVRDVPVIDVLDASYSRR